MLNTKISEQLLEISFLLSPWLPAIELRPSELGCKGLYLLIIDHLAYAAMETEVLWSKAKDLIYKKSVAQTEVS